MNNYDGWAVPFPNSRKDIFGRRLSMVFKEIPTLDDVMTSFQKAGVGLKEEEKRRIESTLRAMRMVEINYYVDPE